MYFASHRAAAGGRTSRRILRFVDKIAKSKYFQKATENEYIKKKIEEMSNTPLLLAVEVQELSGTLAVNIPPPPTDRIWYEPFSLSWTHTLNVALGTEALPKLTQRLQRLSWAIMLLKVCVIHSWRFDFVVITFQFEVYGLQTSVTQLQPDRIYLMFQVQLWEA